METSGGRPTITGACAMVRPLRKILLDKRTRLVITCDIASPPWFGFSQSYQSDHQFLEAIFRFAERFRSLLEKLPVRRRILPAGHVAKDLLDEAFLALRSLCQDLAELSRVVELRAGDSGHRAVGVQIELHLFGLRPPSSHAP